MSNRLVINVTQEDIEEGLPRNSHYCAVARAAARETEDSEVVVNGEEILIVAQFKPFREFRYKLTKTLRTWLRRFDNGEPVKPHRFVVELAPRNVD